MPSVRFSPATRAWILAAACGAGLFLLFALSLVGHGGLMALDPLVDPALKSSTASPWFPVLTAINFVGDFTTIAAIAVVVGAVLWFRSERVWAFSTVSLFVVGAVAIEAAKVAFHRPRPMGALIVETGASFPSGHATAAAIILCLAIWVVERRPHTSRWPIGAAIAWLLAADYDRIALGVHYVTDVLAGNALGVAVAGVVILVANARWRDLGRSLGQPKDERPPTA
ncbi:MAG: phosphatase PAP2 family protein [Thermoplasmatota archaeon]